MSTSSSSDLQGIITATLFQLIIGGVCLAIFSFLLQPKESFSFVYNPKKKEKSRNWWRDGVTDVKRESLLHSTGGSLDATLFLLFIRRLALLFSLMSILSLPLYFVYYYSDQLDNLPSESTSAPSSVVKLSLSTISMANIMNSRSNIFYVAAVYSWVFTFLFLYLTLQSWQEFISLRKKWYLEIVIPKEMMMMQEMGVKGKEKEVQQLPSSNSSLALPLQESQPHEEVNQVGAGEPELKETSLLLFTEVPSSFFPSSPTTSNADEQAATTNSPFTDHLFSNKTSVLPMATATRRRLTSSILGGAGSNLLPTPSSSLEAQEDGEESCKKLVKTVMVLKRNEEDYKLEELLAKHQKDIEKMEHLLQKYLSKKSEKEEKNKKRPTHKTGGLFGIGFLGGFEVDSITFYQNEIRKLEEEIYAIRGRRVTSGSKEGEEVKEEDEGKGKGTTTVFMEFGHMKERMLFQKYVTDQKLVGMGGGSHKRMVSAALQLPVMKPSPLFKDIVWQAIYTPLALRLSKSWIASALLVLLTLGWVFLQGGVSTLSNLIITTGGSIDLPAPLLVFLQAILTPVLAAVLNALLPLFLRKITALQGVDTFSGIERSSLTKYFIFQVYQFVVIVATTVITQAIEKVVTGGGVVSFQVLMNAISQGFVSKSTYFITLVCTGYASFGIGIIQIAPLLVNSLQKKYMALTPRDLEKLNETPLFDFLAFYGLLLLTLLLGLCYSVVSPIILPFCALVFLIAYPLLKYQLIYIYATAFESNGMWFEKVYELSMSALLIGQVTTILGLLVIGAQGQSSGGGSGNVGAPIIVALLVPLTMLFWYGIKLFVQPVATYIALFTDEDEVKESRRERPAGTSDTLLDLGAGKAPEVSTTTSRELESEPSTSGQRRTLAKRRSLMLNPASFATPLLKVKLSSDIDPSEVEKLYSVEFRDLNDYLLRGNAKEGDKSGDPVIVAIEGGSK